MKFSIITPSFNQGRFINECMESVMKQVQNSHISKNDTAIEHIVMDGGSRDSTLEILEAWGAQLELFQQEGYSFQFNSEADGGQTDAINKGLKVATGEILAYLCSDDFYERDVLLAVADVFRNNPETDVVYGDYYFLEGDSAWKRLKKAGVYSRERLLKTNFLGQPAIFWRRRVYEQFGPLDASLKFCMDHEYWLRISGGTRWTYLQAPLASCRLHDSAKSSAQLAQAWWETAEMVKAYGQQNLFYFKALFMQMAGQWLYRGKRFIFSELGKRRGTR